MKEWHYKVWKGLIVETMITSIKRIFDMEYVYSFKIKNTTHEIGLKASLYNFYIFLNKFRNHKVIKLFFILNKDRFVNYISLIIVLYVSIFESILFTM
jgi:hypothetical protein